MCWQRKSAKKEGKVSCFLAWKKNSHLISKYKSLLLTEPCVLVARHIYCPCVCFEILCSTSDWFVIMTPRDGCNGLLLWYHSIFFTGGLASIRHSKYTSVPLAKFLGSRLDPNDNDTIGASGDVGERENAIIFIFGNWIGWWWWWWRRMLTFYVQDSSIFYR